MMRITKPRPQTDDRKVKLHLTIIISDKHVFNNPNI